MNLFSKCPHKQAEPSAMKSWLYCIACRSIFPDRRGVGERRQKKGHSPVTEVLKRPWHTAMLLRLDRRLRPRRYEDKLAVIERRISDKLNERWRKAGQGFVEYAFLIALMAVVCILLVLTLGQVVVGMFQQVLGSLSVP